MELIFHNQANGVQAISGDDVQLALEQIEQTVVLARDGQLLACVNLVRNYIAGMEGRLQVFELEKDEDD